MQIRNTNAGLCPHVCVMYMSHCVCAQHSMIPCGAYSVTQGSISSMSPVHRPGQERQSSYMSTITRHQPGLAPGDLAGVSYYRYN